LAAAVKFVSYKRLCIIWIVDVTWQPYQAVGK